MIKENRSLIAAYHQARAIGDEALDDISEWINLTHDHSLTQFFEAADAVVEALTVELDLNQARQDGWKTRIDVGDVDWESDEEADRWNDAAVSNPHPWNTDLYRAWQTGFMDNDFIRRYNQLSEEFRQFRMTLLNKPEEKS